MAEGEQTGNPGASGTQQGSRTKTPTQARQGVISGRVITVLIISLVLVVVGLVVAFMIGR